jgi:hypothetical protein
MNDRIDALSSEQAQAALQKFYELLPADLWSGSKPTAAAMRGLAEDLQSEADPEVQAQLARVTESADTHARGAIAKTLLHQLSQIPFFVTYLDQAITSASQAKMVALPLAIGATLVVLAVLPKLTRNTDGKWQIEFDPAGNMERLVDSLTGFVKALPKGLLTEGLG